MSGPVRSLLLLPLTLAIAATPAAAQPPFEAELRAGYGLSMGTETDMSTEHRATPLTLTATGAVAISDEPPLSAYGGISVEMIARNTFGFVGGVKLAVPDTAIHLAAGGVWVYAPSTRWGATASAGTCRERKAVALCGDVQLTAYVAGSAIDEGHTVTQLQLVLGMVFDLGEGGR